MQLRTQCTCARTSSPCVLFLHSRTRPNWRSTPHATHTHDFSVIIFFLFIRNFPPQNWNWAFVCGVNVWWHTLRATNYNIHTRTHSREIKRRKLRFNRRIFTRLLFIFYRLQILFSICLFFFALLVVCWSGGALRKFQFYWLQTDHILAMKLQKTDGQLAANTHAESASTKDENNGILGIVEWEREMKSVAKHGESG